MSAHDIATERRFLFSSIAGNALIGCVGAAIAVLSSSQAILLDALFNLTYLASGLFTLKVARLVHQGDDAHFPAGYAYFEPLVNGIKGLLVLGVSVMALAGAVEALFSGGREISPGLAVGYGVFATIVCWIIALLTRRGAKRTSSPLLQADALNWVINGAISSCVLAAFIGMALIRDTALDGLVPYVDPGLVLVVVLISISAPIRMAWTALMELLNRAPTPEVTTQVRTIVEQALAGLPVQSLAVRVVQPGRTRIVLAHVVLPRDFAVSRLADFDAVRTAANTKLQAQHASTICDIVFTADPALGAPVSPAP
ncbi:MAG: cation transporter [Planctomycetota bacterium]